VAAKSRKPENQTNAVLWQAEKGFYLTHAHVTPLTHDFDESAMVSISNALAVYAGLTDYRQIKPSSITWSGPAASGSQKTGAGAVSLLSNQWPNLFF